MPRLFAIAIALVVLLALAVRAAAADLPTFAVNLTGDRIDPARIEVPAATRIKLTPRNTSRGAVEFEGREVRLEKVLGPGAESFVVLPPLAPGTYRFFDEFHPDIPDMMVIAK